LNGSTEIVGLSNATLNFDSLTYLHHRQMMSCGVFNDINTALFSVVVTLNVECKYESAFIGYIA